MTPQYQTIAHDPGNGRYGDCHRAALASVLDLPMEDVPHICDGMPLPDEFVLREREFLRSQGLAPISVPYGGEDVEEVLRCVGALNPGLYFLIGGKSPRGFDHTVVGFNGRIAHDPHPDGGGVVGPMSDGYIWITYFGIAGLGDG